MTGNEKPPAADRHPEICVGAIVVDRGELLLIKRGSPPSEGRWSLPGGRVMWGETLRDAVVRELFEETGQRGVCEGFVGWTEMIGSDHHFVIVDFRVAIRQRSPLIPGDDAEDVAWVPLTELSRVDLVPGLSAFLRRCGVVPEFSDPSNGAGASR
ncbi:MAG: hypothetical protein KatS3mg008_0277 [Acidimicrobiales bacterium]|nr:MAG: hypothetical protein KatS3mg008_0277 [Acidimicrobiales bacterium]